LQLLLRRVQASGTLNARFAMVGEKVQLPADVESELLRIAQEGVTNVLKHARARQVELKLSFGADTVSLTIADDGVGFNSTAHHEGFGLLGMRERAERIGARLLVGSRSGQGTRVETIWPRSDLHRA
jgi:signal transduction histidine kinase